jgi:D-hydroxyproline dehydrogenase subunit gamma
MGSERAAATVGIHVDGRPIVVSRDITLLAALWNARIQVTRTSISGAARGPLCAMGVCFECRVTIDGRPHQRACMTEVREGLEVVTRG